MPILPTFPSFIRTFLPQSTSNPNSSPSLNRSSYSSSRNQGARGDSDQDSATIPPGTITVVIQTPFNGSQIPTITEPLSPADTTAPASAKEMEPITEPNNTAPQAAKPMEATPSTSALASNPVDTIATVASSDEDSSDEGENAKAKGKGGSWIKRSSKSKRLSKGDVEDNGTGEYRGKGKGMKKGKGGKAPKERSEAYNAFWKKLIGVGAEKGKGNSGEW
ncbi:hypothetical protein B0T20DRAFT_473891 [Sordaria brevicollis]|uniref:Uncharacterized protein n=1 Tax=Sordaria brevicollis TaxID=83679 RepID=A0AAE0NVC0_SORBR|nr:hypothetical protein B0T20DRAFT_473891 [Sordaria brevicollis]